MTLTVYTASFNTLPDIIAAMDALLAPLTSRTIVGAGFLGVDQARVQGVELSAYAVLDSTGMASTTPYQVMIFGGISIEDAAAQVNAFMGANPTYFFSPAIFTKLDTVRHTQKDVGLLFYCTNYTDGINNWVPLGSNGIGGGGTVTSVGLSVPTIFGIVGSPITTSGTMTITLANQPANTVLAGPTGGGPAVPTFRALITPDLPPPIPGLVFPVGLAPRDILGGHYAKYIEELDQVYISQNFSGGNFRYIDRVSDTFVDVVTFVAGKTPNHFLYSAPNSKFVFANSTSLFTTTVAGAIISPILAANMASGMALNTQTGHIWGVAGGSGATAMYEMDPATDTVPFSTFLPDGVYGTSTWQGVAYCPTNNSVYYVTQFGKMGRYDISGAAMIPTWVCFVAGGSGTILYDAAENLIYAVDLAGSSPSLKTVTPGVDAVANTYPFPPGYAFNSGGTSLLIMGDYLYIGTLQPAATPVGIMLIFHKPTATFVASLSSGVGQLTGWPLAGVLAENVVYVGAGGSASNNTALIPFRSPEVR